MARLVLLLTILLASGVSGAAEICGDLDGSGAVDASDAGRLRAHLAGLAPPFSIEEQLRCKVIDPSGSSPGTPIPGDVIAHGCSIQDWAVVARALAGRSPGPAPVCPAASTGDCCTAHPGAGCAEIAVAACVCASSPSCCESGWDASCVDAVASLGCGTCATTCGNGICEPGEGYATCPGDCPWPACGDGVCDPNPTATENTIKCPTDCTPVCGDGECAAGAGEDGATCPLDCSSGSCCLIGAGVSCVDPAIAACVCAVDQWCCYLQWDQLCVEEVDQYGCGHCPLDCGDGFCNLFLGESLQGCPADCVGVCGNGACELAYGESFDPLSCPSDCPAVCPDGQCEPAYGEDPVTCPQDCAP